MRQIKISGSIILDSNTTEDEFHEKFLNFIELNDWEFSGVSGLFEEPDEPEE
jgi:hypothetical protein